MQLSINGKQLDVGVALRGHIESRLPDVIAKYFDNPTDAHVTLSRDGNDIRADVSVHIGKGIMLRANAMSGDAYAAFDEAAETVGKRLRRYKRRLRDHHKDRGESVETLPALKYVLAAEDEDDDAGEAAEPDQPVIIAEAATEIENLTASEAVMRMDLANLPALMFRNVAHGGLNMVYRRDDGNIGWVDPRGSRATNGSGGR